MRTPHPAAVPAEWPDAEAPPWFDAPREHGGDGRQQRTRGARAACCLGCLPGRPGRRAQGHRSAAGASAGELPRAAAEPADRYGQAAREDRALKRVSNRAVSREEQSPEQSAVLQRGLKGKQAGPLGLADAIGSPSRDRRWRKGEPWGWLAVVRAELGG